MELLQQAVALAPKIQGVVKDVLDQHIQRQQEVQAFLLSLVAGQPAFYLGSPGVDKTGTVKAVARRIIGADFFSAMMPGVRSFEQLFVARTAIEEFERNGAKVIATRDELGLAANAHIFFGDEIWKAEENLLNPILDYANGDGVRIEGRTINVPLMAFLAASNELPDPESNLHALWSRMIIRVITRSLDRAGKISLVQARLMRDRQALTVSHSAQLTLTEVKLLRQARPHVELPDVIVQTVSDIYEELLSDQSGDFQWAWNDDRRYGRVHDVLQANALLAGRTTVIKADLAVLEWLLWDRPEQIPVVKAKIAPYCRTPLTDAREAVDALLAPGGVVAIVLAGDRSKGVQALTQVEACEGELARLKGEANPAMAVEIASLITQVTAVKADIIAVVTGAKREVA